MLRIFELGVAEAAGERGGPGTVGRGDPRGREAAHTTSSVGAPPQHVGSVLHRPTAGQNHLISGLQRALWPLAMPPACSPLDFGSRVMVASLLRSRGGHGRRPAPRSCSERSRRIRMTRSAWVVLEKVVGFRPIDVHTSRDGRSGDGKRNAELCTPKISSFFDAVHHVLQILEKFGRSRDLDSGGTHSEPNLEYFSAGLRVWDVVRPRTAVWQFSAALIMKTKTQVGWYRKIHPKSTLKSHPGTFRQRPKCTAASPPLAIIRPGCVPNCAMAGGGVSTRART